MRRGYPYHLGFGNGDSQNTRMPMSLLHRNDSDVVNLRNPMWAVHWGQVIQLFDADVSHCADIKRILCILPNAVICSKLEHLFVLYRKPLKSHPLDVMEIMWELIEKLHHVMKKRKKKNRKRMKTGIRLPDVEWRASPPWCYNSPLEKLQGRMVTSFGCSDFRDRLGK